jgi:hypothetical protein
MSLSEPPKKHLIHTPCKTDFPDDGHLAVESIPKTLIQPVHMGDLSGGRRLTR